LKEVIPPLTGGGIIAAIGSSSDAGDVLVLVEEAAPKGMLTRRVMYQWEYSENGSDWVELYGAIAPDLPASRFEKHNYYRRKVKNAAHLSWEYSNVVSDDSITTEINGMKNIFDKTQPVGACWLSASMFLEGAEGEGDLMRDDLRAKGLLPNFSPYGSQDSCQHERVAGDVFQKTGNKAVVDWVSLELYASLKDSIPASSQPALLLRDGTITNLDGQSAVAFFGLIGNKYHLLIRHRNHEPVVSKKLTFKPENTIAATAFFTLGNGMLGDKTATMPSAFHFVDKTNMSSKSISNCYEFYDFNMDGVVIPTGPGNEEAWFWKIRKRSMDNGGKGERHGSGKR
jgi:hypothetical protein